MNKTLNVFILAAGLSERLQPITEHIPKPLLPILGKPVLQSVIEKVLTLPVDTIGINLHYKKEAVANWISHSPFYGKIRLFSEEPVLGTGGALKNAETFLSKSSFLVHNADIISDIDLAKLFESHLTSKNLVTLAVHEHPEFNNIIIDGNGCLKNIGKTPRQKSGKVRLVAFTGIAIYEPEFLKFLPQGISSVVDAWLNAAAAGYKVGTMDVSSCYWKDIGTPSAYASTVFDALRADGETVYIHPSVEGCKDIELGGYVIIEKENTLAKGVFFRNCIVLPGSQIPHYLHLIKRGWGDLLIENCILGPDFKIDIKEPSDAMLISTGGSERKYYRIKKRLKSMVLMQCSGSNTEFQHQIEYTRFFFKHSIPVPELIKIEPEKMRAEFEDLGDITLYSWLKCTRENNQIEQTYRNILDILLMLHGTVTKHVSECPLLQNRIFNYEDFRWETGYFIEQFVKGNRNILIKNLPALKEEFHRLAMKVDSFPKTVVHRDFQSQNIMITKGEIPRLIDYQGARMGPPAYDVVSILWDPYYCLESGMRKRLINYYISKIKDIAGKEFMESNFRETLLPCRLQRHMQALGAYAFLSAIKGKKYFLKHVPEGVRLLKEDVTLSKVEYPELYRLVMRL